MKARYFLFWCALRLRPYWALLVGIPLSLYFAIAQLGRSGSYVEALGSLALFWGIFGLGAASTRKV